MSAAEYVAVQEGAETLEITDGSINLSPGVLTAQTDKGPLQVTFSRDFVSQTLVTVKLNSGHTFYQLRVCVGDDYQEKSHVLTAIMKHRRLVVHASGDTSTRACDCRCS